MAQTLTQVGKYRIERELGRGAMGVVYKAFDPVVERMVAIKTIRLDVEDPQDLVNRLKREAKSVGQLEHPNIVTLYDAGESGGLFYLAMQFIEGGTLQDRLDRQRWFTLKEVQDLFRQICAGLDYAHQHGVIHRDIKPANIMVTSEGLVKLTDFGIAKLAGAGASTSGLIVGTPSYMSPEQAVGKPLDGRSDIFSLGSILYELITGEKAFPGQNTTTVMYKIVHEAPTPIAALQPGLDPAVEAIVLRTLAKQPDQRYQNCSELATALELYINKVIAGIPKTSVTPVPHPPAPAAVPAPLPTPGTVAPGSSAGLPAIAAPVPAATTQTAAGHTGLPLAWLGGGVIGTLLLVILILMVVQMRNPSSATSPQVNNSRISAPAPSPQAATEPAALQPAPQAGGNPASDRGTGQEPAAQPSPPARPALETAAPRRSVAPRVEPPKRAPVPAPVHEPEAPPVTAKQEVPRTSVVPPAQPETFGTLVLQGDLAFQQSRYQDALAAYSKAYQLNTGSREVRRKIAVVLTLLGRPDEAQKDR